MPRMTKEELDRRDQEIVRRYLSGDSVDSIVHGVASGSHSTVYAALRKGGITLREPSTTVIHPPSPSPIQREAIDREIIRRYQSGEKVGDIVRDVAGGSFSRYQAALSRGNIELRYRKPGPLTTDIPRIITEFEAATISKDWEKVQKALTNLKNLLPRGR